MIIENIIKNPNLSLFQEFNWQRIGMLYHNNDPTSGKGNSPCFLTLSAVLTVLSKKNADADITHRTHNFDETNTTTTRLKELIQKLSLTTRSKY